MESDDKEELREISTVLSAIEMRSLELTEELNKIAATSRSVRSRLYNIYERDRMKIMQD